MKLTQIKLSGFKSFVDSTEININGQLVGIVGPNGCGKSNIVDAIKWVLGEASAKQLRGESMQDVIFNGSLKRKPVSRAVVELIFDNSEKRFQLGVWNNYEVIAVKRLITRDGESIYYINNQIVRRKDITELFLGTGVGNRGYAVIEQGMVAKIIEAKPQELMFYLEEASGVSKYHEKRKEALLRLQDTRNNLIRIEDIKDGILKQLEHLGKQAKTATLYQDLAIQLNILQVLQILIKSSKSRDLLEGFEGEIKKLENDYQVINRQVINLNDELMGNTQRKQEEDRKFHELQSQFNQERTHLARLEERIKYDDEMLKRIYNEREDLLVKIGKLREQIKTFKEQIQVKQLEYDEGIIELEQIKLLKGDKVNDFEQINVEYTKAMDSLTKCNKQFSDVMHELDLIDNNIWHKENQKNSLVVKLNKLNQENKDNVLDFSQSYLKLNDEITELGTVLASQELNIEETQTKLVNLETVKNEENSRLNLLMQDMSACTSRIGTLRELIAKTTKYYGNKDFLTDSQLSFIWQEISVDPGFELAVEIALADILKAITLKTRMQMKNLFINIDSKLVLENNLAIWFESDTEVKAAPNSLSQYVKLKKGSLSVLYRILNNYSVVENYNEALTLLDMIPNDKKLISKDGHLITSDYIIFNAHSNHDHVLEHNNELSKLEIQEKVIADKISQSKNNLLEINKAYAIEKDRIILDEKKLRELNEKQNSLKIQFIKEEQIYLETTRYYEKVNQEIQLLNNEIAHIEDELFGLQTKKIKQAEIKVQLDLQLEKEKRTLIEVENKFNSAKTKLQDFESQKNIKASTLELIHQQIINLEKLIGDKSTELDLLSDRLSLILKELELLQSDKNQEELDRLTGETNKLALLINDKKHSLELIMGEVNNYNNRIIESEQNKNEIYKKLNQIKLKEQEQFLLLKNYEEALENFSISDIDKARNILQNNDYNLIKIEVDIKEIQEQIKGLGLVNLKAIEDLSSIQIEYDNLQEQVLDLNQAIIALESAIIQIDEETRKVLNDTYSQTQINFNNYFKTLFGGGIAYLELTNSDILNSGLNIFVEPPGKKAISLHLLSGGEKALTAISLIFALFHLNPSPFCLLDEVDAPLDDANTLRFCKLVEELSHSIQFVFISHNRLTMETAAQLIGVTMQEKGVSNIVSVNLAS